MFSSPQLEEKYTGKLLEWRGTVMRVDSFDEESDLLGRWEADINGSKNGSKSGAFEQIEKFTKDRFRKTGLYAAQVLVRMEPRFLLPKQTPSGTDKNQMPDLILWLDDKSLEDNIDTVDSLRRGSVIKFTGYMHKMHMKIK